jgi:hypothetical protein
LVRRLSFVGTSTGPLLSAWLLLLSIAYADRSVNAG